MNLFLRIFLPAARLVGLLLALSLSSWAQNTAQQLAFAGLRATAGKGQFLSVQADRIGNLYLLFDQRDGVRVLKADANATQVLAETHIGTTGDMGAALALDPSGNVYVTGTTTSGSLPTSSGVPFPSPSDTSTNGFVAKFDSALNPVWVTYTGSGRMAPAAIAATADRVFITGGIYAPTLPVTASAILQHPAPGTSGNGFVEAFDAGGSVLTYATYLTGLNGDTNPAAIAVDPEDNAYIAGYTASSGYPTVAAVVPEQIGYGSGFLTKLTPAGDGIVFSTYIPGTGITSMALDTGTQTLLFSGNIAPGAFPILTANAPLISTPYQSVVRMSLDGTRVLASTLLAPGTQSVVAPTPDGSSWAALQLTTPLLPLPAISSTGSSAAFRLNVQGTIDQSVRFGGPTKTSSTIPVEIASITTGPDSHPVFAGSANPTTSSSLLATETYDLPLVNGSSTVLPSTVRDAVLPAGSNCGSLCVGSGAYLAKLTLTGGPSLAASTDSLPNLVLRNLGSMAATSLQIGGSGFTFSHNCPTQLNAGAACDIILGGGPGTLTVQGSNATPQTLSLPAVTKTAETVVYSPHEVDYGVLTAGGAPITRTVVATNLGSSVVTGALPVSFPSNPNYAVALSGDCPGTVSSQPLAPGASCNLAIRVSVPSSASSAPFQSTWSSEDSSITLAGYTQTTPLSVSAEKVDFGTQFLGGLRLSRYLYLSNHSDTAISHSLVALSSSSPFTVLDRCPTQLEPHTICQIKIDYLSPQSSADSATLVLDQGLEVLVTGKTIPQPGANGETVNPSLVVTPTTIDFANAVAVTGTSANTGTATISNTGSQPFPLSLNLTGDFIDATSCTNVLAAGASCSIVFSFTPSQPGTRQGLLAVSSGSGTTPAYVTLSGTATGILPANNGTLDLGTSAVMQPTIQWYKITQPLSRLTATTSGDFGIVLAEDIGYGHGQPPTAAFVSSVVSSCVNCWLGVQFVPSSVGVHHASLTLTSTSSGAPYILTLTGNGLALNGLLLTPSQQDFGPIAVHSSSSTTLFTLTNLTGGNVSLAAPAVTGDFVLESTATGGAACIGNLAPTASCFVQVRFIPNAAGIASGTLTLSSSAGVATAALSGFGSPDPGLALNPAALVFRNVPAPSATQQDITLTNTGIYDLQLGTLRADAANFQISTNCGTLVPGAHCTATVNYIPSTAIVSAVLSVPVTSNAPGAPQTTYSIPLSGTYTAEDASLQILPAQAAFGPTASATSGITRQFLVNNLTTQPISLSLAMPRQFRLTSAPCATLAGGAGCAFSVSFTPMTNGDITGTLFVQATPSDGRTPSSALAYVEGFGSASGSLAVTGDLLPGRVAQFGQVASGQISTRNITLTNNGTGDVTVRRITSEWPFLSSTTCGHSLSAGASCAVTLTYTPLNQVAAGSSPAPFNTDAGNLVIESDASSSPDLIDLTGTVTPLVVAVPSNSAPLSSFTISQGSLSFETTPAGEISAPQTVMLTNTGTTTLHVKGLITSSDFSVTGTCPGIVPGANCPLTITFTPQASSSQTPIQVLSALEIVSDSSTSLEFISLSGTAAPATLGLSSTTLDFGPVLVGRSATLPITITNYSRNAAVFRSVSTSDDYTVQGDCPASGGQLSSSAKCVLQVNFKPSQTGTRPSALTISTSLTTLPLTVNLTGSGTQSHLLSTAEKLVFSDTLLGASSNLTLSLTNTGSASVTGLSIAITGDYTVQKSCGTTVMTPGARCDLTIAFTPKAVGSRAGTLRAISSDSGSPMNIPLAGNGIPQKGFIVSVDGGAKSSLSVKSGLPASYHLTVTPQNGYTGTVILNCTPVQPAQYATCSLLPSSINLTSSSSQVSVATLNTVMKVQASQTQSTHPAWAICILPISIFFFKRRRASFACCLLAITVAWISGCGSGGTVIINQADPNLHYTPPGTYQYNVTATGTNGAPLTQTVTLGLVVTKP